MNPSKRINIEKAATYVEAVGWTILALIVTLGILSVLAIVFGD